MPSNTDPKSILLAGEPAQQEALVVTAVVTPGHLLMIDSTGKVKPHDSAGGVAAAMVAKERDFLGKTITDTCAIGDTCPYYIGKKGDRFYALVATGNNVAIGTFLESAGTGALRITTHSAAALANAAAWPVFQALEAVNNASGVDQRIRVEVL